MEAMRQSWTDDRLDALNEKVDQRFDQVDQRFDRVESDLRECRAELKGLRSETKGGLESLQRSLVYGVVTLTGGMLAGFAAMVGLVATQV
jgi:hypothetical protein